VESIEYDPVGHRVVLNPAWAKALGALYEGKRELLEAVLLARVVPPVRAWVNRGKGADEDDEGRGDVLVGEILAYAETDRDIFDRVLKILLEGDPRAKERDGVIRGGFEWRSKAIARTQRHRKGPGSGKQSRPPPGTGRHDRPALPGTGDPSS